MILVGIDEVGRGCWAGPLLAAAVILDPARPIDGLNDSKKLSKSAREKLASLIHERAAAVGVGWVWPADVDKLGLTGAVSRAMLLAIQHIHVPYTDIIIDGNCNFLPGHANVQTIVQADGLVPAVSAASIVAKVARDTYMSETAALEFPQYGFEKHVGYGTAVHVAALARHGVTPIHRRSYKPIKQFLLQSGA